MLAAAGLTAGCFSTPQRGLVLDPIGPPPVHASGPGLQGSLVVFSAFDPAPDPTGDPYRHPYSNYRIYSKDGKIVQRVHNDNHALFDAPKEVPLPVDSYRVVAHANGYGIVTVPVVIRPGQRTTVHLEGSPAWADKAAFADSNPVCLPHGEIAGWRADTGSTSP